MLPPSIDLLSHASLRLLIDAFQLDSIFLLRLPFDGLLDCRLFSLLRMPHYITLIISLRIRRLCHYADVISLHFLPLMITPFIFSFAPRLRRDIYAIIYAVYFAITILFILRFALFMRH